MKQIVIWIRKYLLNFSTRAKHLSIVWCICSLKVSQSPPAFSIRYPALFSSTLDDILKVVLIPLIEVLLIDLLMGKALVLWRAKNTKAIVIVLSSKCMERLLKLLLICILTCQECEWGRQAVQGSDMQWRFTWTGQLYLALSVQSRILKYQNIIGCLRLCQ